MTYIEERYGKSIYAGVLGKIIGVYLGRPVEGWAYQKIIDTFDELPYYKHKECGVPLIVADDDISGTFGFFRAMEDNNYPADLSAAQVGDTWRNYIIEDKTILWWGGLGRSTEHTAFLNLKKGIKAPRSGSIAQNGRTLSEQIGAQIFMDAFAMACPEDPDKAVYLARNAASVSHDGIALEAAGYLAAMEAMAFGEKDLNKLMDNGLRYVSDSRLLSMIEDVRNICASESNWREVRSRIDDKYGYHRYPGCCHMVPNHAMVLASLLLGGDNFQKSILIASSAGYDTDCNAGNVGCLNGIRLGLEGIDAGADFRAPVADQLYVVTSDGGSVISDAVQETKSIIRAACALRGEPISEKKQRFTFAFPGSVQGFTPCPYNETPYANVRVENAEIGAGERALAIRCYGVGKGIAARASTPTFLEKGKVANNFSTVASPTLYETQKVQFRLIYDDKQDVSVVPYIMYYDKNDKEQIAYGPVHHMVQGEQQIEWKLPTTEGMPIFRIGLSVESDARFDGTIYVKSLDWDGAPEAYKLQGMLMTSIWNTNPSWLQTWTSSAKQFQADFNYTICTSHPEENGVATIGTAEWKDYCVSSKVMFSLHQAGGLVLRAKGHRRYYAAVFKDYKTVQIIMRKDDAVTVLAEAEYPYVEDRLYEMEFAVRGNKLAFKIDGELVLETLDATYSCGSAGLMIDYGTMCIDGFCVFRMEDLE